MAFATLSNAVDVTAAATFIPEIWSDEIQASYKANLVLANRIKTMPMVGKKGDTIHVPAPVRGSASAKTAQNPVTLIKNTEQDVAISIDKHYEYSRLIEDIVEKQALSSLRRFYTDDAGYALATQVDDDLWNLGKSFGDGDGSDWTHSGSFYPAASTGLLTAYAEDTVSVSTAFTDATMRGAQQNLDDADVPMSDRSFVIPPYLANVLRGIDRYNSQDFVNNKGVENGRIGELYGTPVYISTNSPIIETAAANSAGGDVRSAFLIHKDSMVLAEQMAVRSQTQYKQEHLGDLFTADTIYGVKAYRPTSGISIAVSDA